MILFPWEFAALSLPVSYLWCSFPDNVDIEPKQVAPVIMRDTAGNDDCHAKRVMNAIHHVNLPFHQKRQVGRNCANGVYRKVWTQTKIWSPNMRYFVPFVQIQTKEYRVKWNVQILVIRTKHHLFVVNQQIHSRRKNLRHFFSPKACQLLPPLEEAAPAWIILAMVIVTMQLESNNW